MLVYSVKSTQMYIHFAYKILRIIEIKNSYTVAMCTAEPTLLPILFCQYAMRFVSGILSYILYL